MVNTEPLKNFLKGREAYQSGSKEKALQLLAKSVGATEPTEYMKDNLDQLTEPNDAVLTLIIDESKKE